MGRKRRARSKSNLKFRNKKIKENRLYGKYEKEEGMDDGECDNKEKKKKSFWMKWLNFFRRQFVFKKTDNFVLEKDEGRFLNKEDNRNDSKIGSRTSSLDIIEIPIQPGKKISKILIKPTKNGIKAMIAQYEGSSLLPSKMEKKFSVANNLEKNKSHKQFNYENPEIREKRLNHNFKEMRNECEEIPKNENSLMSALYVRQDTDNVESTFFIEPKLTNECVESKKAEDFSQKSLAINQGQASYKVFDEISDEDTKTFKTVSEPTWSEKEKIFHQQKLQENLNELLEQFILLQSDDLINFAAEQNKVNKETKTIQCDGDESSFNWIETNDKPILKELSREVSPEILVNIKPFKQYLPGTYIKLQEPSIEFVEEKRRDVTGDQETKITHKQKSQMQKKFKNHKTKAKMENKDFSYHCPVVRSKLQFSGNNNNNNLNVESSRIKTLVSDQSTEKEENKTTDDMSYYILDCDVLTGSNNKDSLSGISGDSKANTPNHSGFCSVWGVYKSYANLETVNKKEYSEKNKAIDEVLDSFDDRNHDLIFKKNMTQFRRKINSKAFFVDKNVDTSTEIMRCSDVKEKKISINETVCEIQEGRCVLNMKEKNFVTDQNFVKKLATATLQKINLYNGYKHQKILATYSWLLSKGKELGKTIASRIEMSTILCPQYFREINNLLETNISIVIEIKPSKPYNDITTILHKRNTEVPKFENDLQEWLLSFKCAKKCVEIELQDNELQNESIYGILRRKNSKEWQRTDNIANFMCPKYFLNSTYYFQKLENHTFTNTERPGICKSQRLFFLKNLLKESNLLRTEDLSLQNDENLLRRKALVFYEVPFRQMHKVVEIINDMYYDFTVLYQRKEFISLGSFKSTAKNLSDTVILGKNDKNFATRLSSEVFTTRASLANGQTLNTKAKKNSKTSNHEINPTTNVRHKLECSVPMGFQRENMIPEISLSEPTVQEIIKKNHKCNEVNKDEQDTKSLINLNFDGFYILYDALHKGSSNNHEDIATKTDSENSFSTDILSSKFLSLEKKKIFQTYDDNLTSQKTSLVHTTEVIKGDSDLNKPDEKPTPSLIQDLSQIEISETEGNKNGSITLKYKSNSSPKENILQADYNMHEHRMRRSLNFAKDVEKFDFYNYKKKRISIEKGTDIRRTGSASLETHTAKSGKNKSLIAPLQKKESIGAGIKFKSQLFTDELKAFTGTENISKPNLKLSITKILSKEKKASLCEMSNKKYLGANDEKKKMYVFEKNGVNVRKEVVAAFNSIKDLAPCRKESEGGNKRMSLVIMLSRNK